MGVHHPAPGHVFTPAQQAEQERERQERRGIVAGARTYGRRLIVGAIRKFCRDNPAATAKDVLDRIDRYNEAAARRAGGLGPDPPCKPKRAKRAK